MKIIHCILLVIIVIFKSSIINAQIWPQSLGIMGDSRALQIGAREIGFKVISEARLYYPKGPILLDSPKITPYLMAYNIMGGTTSSDWVKECSSHGLFPNWTTFISLGGNDMLDAFEATEKFYGFYLLFRFISDPILFAKRAVFGGFSAYENTWWVWNMQISSWSTTNNMDYIMSHILESNPFSHVLLNDVAPVTGVKTRFFIDMKDIIRINMFMGLLNSKYQNELIPRINLKYPTRASLVVTAPYFWNNIFSYSRFDVVNSYYIFDGQHFNDPGLEFWGQRIAMSLLNNGWFPPNPQFASIPDTPTGPPSSPTDTTPPTFINLPTLNQIWMNQWPLILGTPIGERMKVNFQIQDDIGIQKVEGAKILYYDESTNTIYSNSDTLRNYQVELDPNVDVGLHSTIVTAYDTNNNVKILTIKYLKEITEWLPWTTPWGIVIVYNMKFTYWVE